MRHCNEEAPQAGAGPIECRCSKTADRAMGRNELRAGSPCRDHDPTFSPPLSTLSFVNRRVPRMISLGGFLPEKISVAARSASLAPLGYSKVASRIPFLT